MDTPQPTCPPPVAEPKRPAITLPSRSCDSHFHIFGPHRRFPYAAGRTFTPHDAPKEALERLHRHLGFERGVIVQSACHGNDHAALLDALEHFGGRYRGVGLLTPGTAPAEVARLDRAGIRGVRFHFLPHLGGHPPLADMQAVMRLVEPHGWHIAIHVTGKELLQYADFIRSIRARVVIDHIGRVDAAEGPEGLAFRALLGLLDTGNVWVKLSGSDRISREAYPYPSAVALARRLAAHAPERVVWGSDWPHPNIHGPMPDDGALVDLIAAIAPDEAGRHRMLVDNPAKLFGF